MYIIIASLQFVSAVCIKKFYKIKYWQEEDIRRKKDEEEQAKKIKDSLKKKELEKLQKEYKKIIEDSVFDTIDAKVQEKEDVERDIAKMLFKGINDHIEYQDALEYHKKNPVQRQKTNKTVEK